MSANANVLGRTELLRAPSLKVTQRKIESTGSGLAWNTEDYGREQIRGLVRRVFLSPSGRTCHHVVFSPAEPGIDVTGICAQVALSLSLETPSHIALLETHAAAKESTESRAVKNSSIKSCSEQINANLWRVRSKCSGKFEGQPHWPSFLAELRSEFEYAVIQGPAVALSSDAGFLGRLTDGVILVLGARSTRKAAARNVKEILQGTQSRILGAVLSDRTFPIPDYIYRRL
jgi:hypothetical protein